MSERIKAAREALESGRVKLVLPGAVREALHGLLDEFEHMAELLEDRRTDREDLLKQSGAVAVVAAATALKMHERKHHPAGAIGGELIDGANDGS
jgi:hypothetical protein